MLDAGDLGRVTVEMAAELSGRERCVEADLAQALPESLPGLFDR